MSITTKKCECGNKLYIEDDVTGVQCGKCLREYWKPYKSPKFKNTNMQLSKQQKELLIKTCREKANSLVGDLEDIKEIEKERGAKLSGELAQARDEIVKEIIEYKDLAIKLNKA